MNAIHARRAALLLVALGAMALPQPAHGTGGQPNWSKADIHGDPLPDGALARLGTVRWRHGGPVTFVGYTAQGKQLVTGSTDGFFRVWDVGSGREIRRFGKGVSDSATTFAGAIVVLGAGQGGMTAMSPDGAALATQDDSGIVRAWDMASGKEIPTSMAAAKQGPRALGATGLAFSRDGKTLAIRSADQTVRLIDIRGGKPPRTLTQAARPDVVRFGGSAGNTIVFTPDGKFVLSVGIEQENQKSVSVIRFFDIETGNVARQIKVNESSNFIVGGLAISPDGKTLVWAGQTGIVLYDVESGKETRKLGPRQNLLAGALAFSPDSKVLATRPPGGVGIQLWNVEKGTELARLGGAAPAALQANLAVALARVGAAGAPTTIAFSPDGQTLSEGSASSTVRFWNVATHKEIPSAIDGHSAGVSQLAISTDGKTLTTFAADKTIRRWDAATGKQQRRHDLAADAGSVALSADGMLAATASNSNTVRLWDVASGKESRTLTVGGPRQGVAGNLALSADNKLLAFRGADQTIRVFDTASGKEVSSFGVQAKTDPTISFRPIQSAAAPLLFAPHGPTLAALSSSAGVATARTGSASVLFWNPLGKRPREFDTQEQPILAMAFSADGRSIVTVRADKTVSLWEILTGKEYAQFQVKDDLQPPTTPVRVSAAAAAGAPRPSLALSPDGRIMAIGGRDIRLYELSTGKALGQLVGHLGPVSTLRFGADGKTLFSGSADTTALVWNTSRFIPNDTSPADQWTDQERTDLWKDLAAEPAKAVKAMQALDAQPNEALAIIKDRLKPAPGVEAAHIEKLVADLDSEQFPLRKSATQELEKLGELAQPAMEKALEKKPALEMQRRIEKLLDKIVNDLPPSPAGQQAIRAMHVLEKAATPEARELLVRMAQGAPGHRLTRHAEDALKRLGTP